jgi:hypothetical protein
MKREALCSRLREMGDGVHVFEAPYEHDDGWSRVTVEWSEDEGGPGIGKWVARLECAWSVGQIGIGDTQLEALAELCRAQASIAAVYARDDAKRHRAITSSPDVLLRDIVDCRTNLGTVQHVVCNELPGPDDTELWNAQKDKALKPLWRAGEVLDSIVARLAAEKETWRELERTVITRVAKWLYDRGRQEAGPHEGSTRADILASASFALERLADDSPTPAPEPDA